MAWEQPDLELGNIMMLGICKVGRPGTKMVWHRRELAFCYKECNGATEGPRWAAERRVEKLSATHVPDMEVANPDRLWQDWMDSYKHEPAYVRLLESILPLSRRIQNIMAPSLPLAQ